MKTHTKTSSIRRGILAATILGTFAATALTSHAAVVTWGGAQNVSGDTDVSTAGTLVGAFNLGGPGVGNTTVNGTTFTALAVTGSSVTSGNFNVAAPGPILTFNGQSSGAAPFSILSAPYQSLLSSFVANNGQAVTLTMNGLVTGATYQFEWWSTRAGSAGFLTTATAGNSVTLNSNPTGLAGGPGTFAIGTFVADVTSQAIVFSSPSLGAVNGFQLRDLSPASAVPEPGSALAGMLALGVCLGGLAGRSRRQIAAA